MNRDPHSFDRGYGEDMRYRRFGRFYDFRRQGDGDPGRYDAGFAGRSARDGIRYQNDYERGGWGQGYRHPYDQSYRFRPQYDQTYRARSAYDQAYRIGPAYDRSYRPNPGYDRAYGSGMAYDRSYRTGLGYDQSYRARPEYDEPYRTRPERTGSWQTNYGDPFGDRERGTPIRVERGSTRSRGPWLPQVPYGRDYEEWGASDPYWRVDPRTGYLLD